jgi:ribosomal protein S18 acetylase RimI-like enzyme
MIRYVHTIEGITPEQLEGFFEGWPDPPSPETHLKLLENSDHVVLALDGASGNVIGFITAISDGVLSAYIPLLEVLPEHRGKGIGSELVRRMLDRLSGLYMVDLVCDTELQAFYASLGMRPATGMMVRNYERQSGRPKGSEAR